MRTEKINIYSFDELSEDAKQKAIDQFRYNDNDGSFYFDEVIESVKAVCNLFDLKTGRQYSDIRYNHIDDNILQLSGFRLQKYIWNNYKHDLFKGKYYSLWSKKDKSFKHYKEGYPVLKSRYSKLFLSNECVLTGVCYDDDILQPVYDFLNKPDKSKTFEDLIKEIENAISKTFEDVETWLNSDEFIIDLFQANDYEFTEDGNIYR
jgi:hypothetical protein